MPRFGPPLTRRSFWALLALFALLLGTAGVPGGSTSARAATPFHVIAFYDGTYDAAHISFDHEANQWFPQQGALNGFTYTSTTDWTQLNTANLKNYQVVLFLDDAPHTAAQQTAFQQYVQGGGGWLGFHVSAFTTDPGSWPWYYNTFLGSGAFETNSWGPTSEPLKIEDHSNPATASLPATITSSVSEWYSWSNDLRKNPDIDILASIDPSGFPVGTDPNQTWYSGYYPVIWTNRNYRMLYANFGHNAMDYATNTTLSSTFASAEQDSFLINGLRWLAGAGTVTPPPPGSPTGPITGYGGKCVDVNAASSANGTAVQLYDCNGTAAQSWTVGTDGTLKALGKCMDVTGASTANGAQVQLYDCNGTAAQSWSHQSNGELVNTGSGKCLDATGPSSANLTRLQIWTCADSANQQWNIPS
ncbi:ThuA domain-containing protein [Streptacidiphilus cavernicola]|uniref:ThuA domain-containing protein n=1 Tax=Streptacidiphilus cavernicola TaxID=3342716 RepID=A0ABV6VW98_9ACTN